MVKFLEKRQLTARGLSCGKVRRRDERGRLLKILENGPLVRIAIILSIATGLIFLISLGGGAEIFQRGLIAILILAAALAQLWMSHEETVHSNSRLILIFGMILFQLAIIKLLFIKSSTGIVETNMMSLLIPYAFAPLATSLLLGRRDAIFVTIAGSLWGAFLITMMDPVFFVISLATGFVVILATHHVRRRSRLIKAGLYGGITPWFLTLLFGKIGPLTWNDLSNMNNWSFILLESFTIIGIGVATAIIVSGLLPIIEFFFRVTTDISWLEMADLNHPLLKRLSLEAPGTYQHSMAMANLAESAAEAIDANPTICRVGAYFHDIGKLTKPDYFTENISSAKNPHDELTPTMSALIITAHIKEGIDLGLKHRLHPHVIAIIREHHGTTMVGHFFQKAHQQREDTRLGGRIMNIRPEDIPAVHSETFRYPGPKPQTKEAAIIGLADAAESASRSMEHPTPQRLDDLVHALLRERLQDGQYDECPITMKELHQIADKLVSSLLRMHHRRIAYKSKAIVSLPADIAPAGSSSI